MLLRLATCVPANAKKRNIVVPINSPTIATKSIGTFNRFSKRSYGFWLPLPLDLSAVQALLEFSPNPLVHPFWLVSLLYVERRR